jgi:hypothetical protein
MVRGRRIATLLVLAALAVPVMVAAQGVAGPVIDGRLLDVDTGAPIAQGSIQLLRADGSAVQTALSDSAGRFRVQMASAGTYRLRAERLGYQTATSPPLSLQQGDTLGVDFQLSARAVVLEPLVVRTESRAEASRYAAIGMTDFYRRMMRFTRASGGTFLPRDTIARYENGASTSRMLSRVPGINLVGSSSIAMRNGCTPRYYLNGAPYTVMGGTLDTLFAPETLEAVEVYVGTAVPGEFFGGNCGVIVLWTRRT